VATWLPLTEFSPTGLAISGQPESDAKFTE